MNTKTKLATAALAGLFTACMITATPAFSGEHEKGSCKSANGCKGKTSSEAEKEKHACKGQNSCKGQGADGKNECKGKGSCATDGSKPE